MATELNLFNFTGIDYLADVNLSALERRPVVKPEKDPKDVLPRNIREQYDQMKAKHPDAVLLFRVGDFYETFCEDAKIASDILGIVLSSRTTRDHGTFHLAGFPHHALDVYLPKIVRKGRGVAICEQLEDPKLTKKFVKRGGSL